MKSIFFSIFLLISTLSFGQKFYAYGNLSSRTIGAGLSRNITITLFNGGYKPYPDANYATTDITTGMVVWINCTRFPITAIVSTSPLVLTVADSMGTGGLDGLDLYGYRLAILEESRVSSYNIAAFTDIADGNAGTAAGLSPKDGACIQNYYGSQLDLAITSGSGSTLEITQTSHGYTSSDVGKLVYLNASNQVKLAHADLGNADSLAQWVISERVDANNLELCNHCFVTLPSAHGITQNSYIWLGVTPGSVLDTATDGRNVQFVGKALDTVRAYFQIGDIALGGSGGGLETLYLPDGTLLANGDTVNMTVQGNPFIPGTPAQNDFLGWNNDSMKWEPTPVNAIQFLENNLTVTVGSGGDYPTLNSALSFASKYISAFDSVIGSYTLRIRILPNTTLTERVLITSGNWSNVKITSNNAGVIEKVGMIGTTPGALQTLLYFSNCTPPIIDSLYIVNRATATSSEYCVRYVACSSVVNTYMRVDSCRFGIATTFSNGYIVGCRLQTGYSIPTSVGSYGGITINSGSSFFIADSYVNNYSYGIQVQDGSTVGIVRDTVRNYYAVSGFGLVNRASTIGVYSGDFRSDGATTNSRDIAMNVGGGTAVGGSTYLKSDVLGGTDIATNQTTANGTIYKTLGENLIAANSKTALTNTVSSVGTFTHSTTGTATTGFGGSTSVVLENASGTNVTAGIHEFTWSDATSGSEDATYYLKLPRAGTPTNAFTVSSLGVLTADNNIVSGQNITANGNMSAGGAGVLFFTGRSRLSSPADGQMLLANNGASDFNRLQFGGTTSSFPSLKRSTTNLQARLADDSAYTQLISGGTTTNDNAAAGTLGEYVSSTLAVGSALSLSTGTPKNVDTLTLTAGDWDVEGNINFSGSSATITGITGGINITTETIPTDGTEVQSGVQVTILSITDGVTLPRKRISVSGTTEVYLIARSAFSAGTVTAYGSISARRVR